MLIISTENFILLNIDHRRISCLRQYKKQEKMSIKKKK